jgi:hypothetical protein
MKIHATISVILILTCFPGFSQSTDQLPPEGGGEYIFTTGKPCLSEGERSAITERLRENITALKKEGKLKEDIQKMVVSFDWPLRKDPGLEFNDYYGISNFVDQNAGGGILDYNCDSRTYNGHHGTDYFTWPFPWYIYDNNFVEAIAGEAGTIIGKDDNQDDDHCACSGNWNAVYIQHADGSIAWYGHLKNNSLTPKTVGQTVFKGEYLGVVASSGCSTGPHLHFEVYDSGNNLIDPYQGSCNSLNANSWWASQPAYREPTVNAILTHNAAPLQGCPGVNEAPNMSNDFSPGQTIYTAAYYHDQLQGDVSTYRIRKPDNSVWQTWNSTSPSTYNASWWYWTWVLPSGGPFGAWTFEVVYYGQTFTHPFNYAQVLPVELRTFYGKATADQTIMLNWSTASEVNNQGFEVEHSTDGIQWKNIGFVPGNGTSAQINTYGFLHKTPASGMNYYRLKQIDNDLNIEYSYVVNIVLGKNGNIQLAPNPARGLIEVLGIGNEHPEVILFDSMGNKIRELKLDQSTISVTDIPVGLYFMSICIDGQYTVKRFVKI